MLDEVSKSCSLFRARGARVHCLEVSRTDVVPALRSLSYSVGYAPFQECLLCPVARVECPDLGTCYHNCSLYVCSGVSLQRFTGLGIWWVLVGMPMCVHVFIYSAVCLGTGFRSL